MKMRDFRELTVEELQQKHEDLWTELFGLKIKHALGQLDNPLRLRDMRRDIARTKTLLTQHGVRDVVRPRRRRRPPAAAKAAAPAATQTTAGKTGSRKEAAGGSAPAPAPEAPEAGSAGPAAAE